jgi:hypothetical protein
VSDDSNTQIIKGVLFRRHDDGWYPRRCSMCKHFRYDRPYIIPNSGAGIIEAWREYVDEHGETIYRCALRFPSGYTPTPFPQRLCAAYPQPGGWPGEPFNLDNAGVRVSEEVPDWCDRFAFFFE